MSLDTVRCKYLAMLNHITLTTSACVCCLLTVSACRKMTAYIEFLRVNYTLRYYGSSFQIATIYSPTRTNSKKGQIMSAVWLYNQT